MNEEKKENLIQDPDQFEDISQQGTYGSWRSVSGGAVLTGTYRTGLNLRRLIQATTPPVPATSTVFQVLNSSNVVQTGWTITTNPSNYNNLREATITATPPSGVTSGSFRLRASGIIGMLSSTTTFSVSDSSSLVTLTGRQYTRTLTLPSPYLFAGTWTAQVRLGAVVQTGWTISINPSNYQARSSVTITVTEPTGGAAAGSYHITFSGRDDEDNARTLSSTTFTISATVVTATWGSVSYTNARLQSVLTFSSAITGLELSDFEVLNSSDEVQQGWTVNYFNPASTFTSATVQIRPPFTGANGLFKIRLKATSVRGSGATSNNSPVSAAVSGTAYVDNRSVGTWGTATGGTTLSATFTVSSDYNPASFTSADFAVLDSPSFTVVSGWTIAVSPSGTNTRSVTVTATPPSSVSASFYRLRLLPNSVTFSDGTRTRTGPEFNVETSNAIGFGTPIVATATWQSIAYNTDTFRPDQLIGQIRFSHSVIGISPSDFEVIDGNNDVDSDWIIEYSGSSGGTYNSFVIAYPILDKSGSFRLRLKASQVQGPGANTPNSPSTAVTSGPATVNFSLVPLFTGTRWSASAGVPTSVTPESMASDGSKLYIRTNGNSGRDIKRFTLTGTYESAGDVTIAAPPRPTDVASTKNITKIIGLVYHNSKFYILYRWGISGSYDYVLVRYSTSFVREADQWIHSRSASVDIIDFTIDYSHSGTVEQVELLGNNGFITQIELNNINRQGVFTPADGNYLAVARSTSLQRLFVIYANYVQGHGYQFTREPTQRTALPTRLGDAKGAAIAGTNLYILANDTVANDWSVYSYDTTAPSVVLTAAFSNTRVIGSKFQADLTFTGGRASGIGASDFEVINASNQVQTGWTFDTPPSTATAGVPITIAVTPPSTASGTFRIRLKASSVRGGGATSPNSPVAAVTSEARFISQLTFNRGDRLDVSDINTKRRAGIFITSTDHTQTALDDKLYHLERNFLSASGTKPGTVSRFTRTGSDDRAAEASQALVAPPKPTGIGASYNFSYHNGLIIYNQKYYVGAVWIDGSNTQSSVEIYNTNGTHDSNLFVDTDITINDLSVFGNKIFTFNNNTTGTNSLSFRVRNITNGTLLNTVPMTTGATAATAIAVSSELIYVAAMLSNNEWYIRAYDHSYNRVSVYDTLTTYRGTGPNDGYLRRLAIGSDRMYAAIGRSTRSFRRTHFYTNVRNPVKNIWETPTSTAPRVIQAVFIRSAPDRTVTAANFEVQKLTGSTWATDSNWTITKSSDIVAESPWWTITATGSQSVTAGSYRIVLKQNALGTHAALPSSELALSLVTPATATWSNVSFTAAGKLQGTLTFNQNVTGIAAADFEIRNDSDVVQSTGWTFDTIPATATANTGITIAATPSANTVGSFKIRLKADSIRSAGSSTDNSPESALDTDDIDIDNRPVVAVSTFALRSGSTTSASTATREFTLDFDRDIDAIALTSADFTISNTAVTFASISPATGTEDTYTVTVNQPANARGDYTITLAANSIPAKANTYKLSPASASTTASASFDRRVAVSVSARTLPTGTQRTATISGSITFNIAIPATQLINSDFTLTRGATIALASATGSNSTYNFTITQPTNEMGSYTVMLNARAIAQSNTYLQGPTTAYNLGTVTYDTRSAITASWTEPTGTQTGATADFTLTFGLAVPANQLSNTDFTVTGGGSVAATGAISPTSGSQTAYTITVTQPTTGMGSYTIALNADTVATGTTYLEGPDNAVTSSSVSYDRRARVNVTGDTLPATTQTGATVAATITFDQSIPATELTSADFDLSAGSIAVTETTGSHTTFNLVITQPTSGNGTYTVSLNANAIPAGTGYLQGPLSAYSLGTVTYDRRTAVAVSHFRPKLTTDAAESAATREFELDLDRDVTATELTQADFTISNSAVTWNSISPTSGDEDVYTITVNQSANTSGSYTITLRQNAIPDKNNAYLQGPSSTSAASADFDTRTAISVSSDTLPSTSQTGATITGSITFDRAVPASELTNDDFTLTGGATLALDSATGSNNTYNFTITQPTNGMSTYTVSLNANAISTSTTYLQGPTSAYSLGTVTYDTRRAVTASWTEPTGTQTGATADFTLTFNQSVPANQLSNTDFTVTGGASIAATGAISPSTGSATSYTITVTQPTTGMSSYTVALKADAINTGTTYLQGPDNAVTSTAVSYDRRSRVNVTGDTLPSTTQRGATVAATITFDRAIPATELTAADFTLSAGSIAVTETTGSHTTFNLTITQPTSGNGTYTVSLNANAIPTGSGYLGGPLNAYSLGTVTYDRRTAVAVSHFRPKLTTNAAESASTREFELDFDRDITASELAQADFTISDSAVTWSSISPTTGDEDTYTITVNQPANDHGDYTITLAANSVSAKNNAYLAGPANAFASASADFDTRTAVSVSSDTLPSTEQTGATVTGTITFDRAVPPIDTNDFTLSGGATIAITETTGTQATYNFTITQPTNSMGSYTVDLNMNVVSGTDTYLQGPTTAYRLGTVTYDTRSAITASWAEPTGVQTGATSQLTLTLNNTVPAAQITSADFTVSGGLSYTISPSTGNASTYTITVTHTANTDGDYTVTFAQNAVATASTYLQGPTSAVTSSSVDYDTRARVTVTGDTLPATEQTGNTVAATITFSRSIPATELTASDFTLSAGSIAITETSGNHQTFNLVITQPTTGNGTYTVSLNADAISDGTGYLGGPVNAYSLGTVTYDRRSAITVSSFALKSPSSTSSTTATREFELELSDDVPASEITTSDFTTSNTAVTVASVIPTTGSQDTYTVTVNQPANTESSYTVTFARNSISARDNAYLQGPSAASTTTSTSFDTRRAIAVTSFGPVLSTSAAQEAATREFRLVLARTVDATQLRQEDFTISDSNVTWNKIAPETGNEHTYTITVNQPTNNSGSYTIALRQNAIATATTYLQGPSSAYTSSSASYDRRTAISVDSHTLPTGEQTGATIRGQIVFDRAIPADQLANSDFTLTGSATLALDSATGNQATYDFTITQPTGNGSYTVSLNANAIASTTTYKAGPTSAYSLGTVNYDQRPVVGVDFFVLKDPSTTNAGTATREFELEFDRNIDADELMSADFTISNSAVTWNSISPTTGQDNVYTITVNQPANAHGSYTITLAADSIDAKDNAYKLSPTTAQTSSPSTSFDRRDPIGVTSFRIEGDPAAQRSNPTVSLLLVFEMPIDVSELMVSDFSISVTSGGTPTIATVDPISPSNGLTASFRVNINQPVGTGAYTISLKANSIGSGTTYSQGPENIVSANPISYSGVVAAVFQANWDPNNVAVNDEVPTEADRSVTITIDINEQVIGRENDTRFEVVDDANVVQTGWIISTTSTASPIHVTATPPPNVMPGNYRVRVKVDGFGTGSPSIPIPSPIFAVAAQMAPPMVTTIPGGRPGVGFREAILRRIEKRICDALIIDDPEIEYQNDVEGYQNLYRLKFMGTDQQIMLDSPSRNLMHINTTMPLSEADRQKLMEYREHAFMAPRIPNFGYSTPLHVLHCRPIKNFDVTGLRPTNTRGIIISETGGVDRKIDHAPTAFLHIIDGEKDIYWPQRNRAAKARLDHQVEYMKIAIDCVFRDTCTPQPADQITGNGIYWMEQISKCLAPPVIPKIVLQNPAAMPMAMPPVTTYQAEYHRTINQQAVQFVQDIESLLDPNDMKVDQESDNYKFGPNDQYQAWLMNTNLAMWGMLPESNNAPTDTVRCVFEFEVHYPKVYDLQTGTQGTD